MKNFQVAIDGPAGSGKSSISEIVSKRLGFTHIDTGAMYRAVTLEAMKREIDLADEAQYNFIDTIVLTYEQDKTILEGEDVSSEIRSIPVTRNVSLVSSLKRVRDKMVYFQRESAKKGLVLMDGRDIGTCVLPKADLKIFLTASPEERAKRRLLELKGKGLDTDFDSVLEDIKTRDYKDSHRAISPLMKASDALEIDTTNMTIDEVANKIVDLIKERIDNMEQKETMEDLLTEGTTLKKGDIVKGEVVQVGERVAYVDLGQPSEGVIYINHYTQDKDVTSFKGLLNVGDEITAKVSDIHEGDEGLSIKLSCLDLIKNEKYEELAKKFEEEGEFDVVAKVVKVNDKSNELVYNGVRVFVSVKDLKDAQVGDEVKVRITRLVEDKHIAFASRYLVVKAEKEAEHEAYVKKITEERNAELDKINVGDTLEGTVTNILPYGVVVRFEHVQGLVRMKDLAHEFLHDAKEVVAIGDKVLVKVVKKENGKLELSRKDCIDSAYTVFKKSHNQGDKISVKVVNKMPFGLLCEVAPKLVGLLHKSEYSWNPNDNYDASVVIGDTIEACILKLTDEGEKVSLSRKVLIDNPWSRVTLKVGDVVTAKISEIDEKKMTVSVDGVDGVIPARSVVCDGKSTLITDYYAIGDEVTAKVVEVNKTRWVLVLDQKAYQREQDKSNYSKYMKDSDAVSQSIGDLLKEELKK